MADRALVSLDQTASPHPPLPRQQRQRDPPPDLCRDDRLRAAAHRRPPPLRQDLDPALHRSGRSVPLPTPPPRRHRQTPAHQLKPPAMPKRQKSIELQLCLSFPGQPCASREREGPTKREGEGAQATDLGRFGEETRRVGGLRYGLFVALYLLPQRIERVEIGADPVFGGKQLDATKAALELG